MNSKTVRKLLIKKHVDFLNSIEDEEVRDIIDKKSIITGGAIVSMLLNEKVNDYDYYFSDIESCRKVAEYFVNRYLETNSIKFKNKEIIPTVIEKNGRIKVIIKSVGMASENNSDNYEYFEQRPSEEGESYVEENTQGIAEKADELDEIPYEEMEKIEGKGKYRVVFMTSNAITLSNGVQIILRFWGNPEEIHKNYDFVHCTNYWLSKDRKLYLNQEALEAILSKTLVYKGSLYPICSVIRTRKFIKRGWNINAGQYLKMCFQISNLNLSDIEVLDDQLIGVDSAYFAQVIEYLKERMNNDPDFKLDSTYLVSIIDKIF